MLTEKEAMQVAISRLPGRRVKPFVLYKSDYLIQAFDDSDPEEGEMDAVFAVDSITGELKGFSFFDADMDEITRLWKARQATTH